MKNLQNSKWMYLKAGLFLLMGITSAVLIFAANATLQTAILLALVIWSFCRAYYFAFYVIEKYIDPTFKFAGLFAVIQYVTRRKITSHSLPDQTKP
jgi:hypothetical protein